MGEGLKGAIRMRWALTSDVKKRGAKKESQFYKKYGAAAGREGADADESRPLKRSRDEGEISAAVQKAQLDDDLEAFLAEDNSEPSRPPSPPSKMRSDYIDAHGKTLLERTSDIREHSVPLTSRLTDRRPRRSRGERGRHEIGSSLGERISDEPFGRRRSRDRGARRGERPKLSQAELDAELDAFLNTRDD